MKIVGDINSKNTFTISDVIGCIHVLPLPGSPSYRGSMEEIIECAVKEAKIYNKFEFNGLIIENMHDVPYNRGYASPETTAAMAAVCQEVRKITKLSLGIQILAGAAVESLAVAVACDLQFLRVEGYSFAHIADEGIMQSCAASLLRKRSELKGDEISVWADIKKKHSSHAITADVSIGEMAEACEFMKADGIIVTGRSTGKEANIKDLDDAKKNTKLPVIIGSGITAENFHIYKDKADAFIVGSYFKKDGYWENEIDESRVKKLLEVIK